MAESRAIPLLRGGECVPRYFFNVHDGAEYPDLVGRELAGLDAARRESLRYALEMLSLEPAKFWNDGEWSMDVCDDAGLLAFTIRFGAEEQPASQRAPYGSPAAVDAYVGGRKT